MLCRSMFLRKWRGYGLVRHVLDKLPGDRRLIVTPHGALRSARCKGAQLMDMATFLAVVGIVLAIAVPIVVALWVEARKRAHLEIVPSAWHAPNFVAWTFATVRVRNKPLPPRLSRHLSREEAHGCIVEIDYYHWDSGGRLFPTIRGRWSSAPEPLRRVPPSLLAELSPGSSESSSRGQAIVPGTYSTGAASLPVSGGTASTFQPPRTTGTVGAPVSGGTASTFQGPGAAGSAGLPVAAGAADASVVPPGSAGTLSTSAASAQHGYSIIYDPERDPRRIDVAVSPDGEEVAVAILRDGEAFAFSTESYDYDRWGNPAWRLEHGTYRIVVRVRGSGILEERQFKLEYLNDDVSKFNLETIDRNIPE